jgi:ribosomal protein S18 acetylase RimI-like enzyme
VSEVRAGGVPLAVIGTDGDDGHAPARALYERHGFTGLPLVRYYRAL